MIPRLANLTAEYNELTVQACEMALRTIIASVDDAWRERNGRQG